MKKIVFIAVLLMAISSLTACDAIKSLSGGAQATGGKSTASISYSSTTSEPKFNEYNYNRGDYDANYSFKYSFDLEDIVKLGPVTYRYTNSTGCVGSARMEQGGLARLMLEARKKYPDADGLVNIYFDRVHEPGCFSFIKDEVLTTITATAVKMK